MARLGSVQRWSSIETSRKILSSYKHWAVVGMSTNPSRPSFSVATYLLGHGYKVIPVNPSYAACQGITCYPKLADVPNPEEIEVVDIFRRSDAAGMHVDEAIELGAKAVWMQLGVIDEEAAARAEAAGLDVVMDRCPAIDHPRLFGR